MSSLPTIATPGNRKPVVALYARVSTKEKGQTNENQLRQLRAYVKRMGWQQWHYEITDEVSGATDDRPGLDALLEAAASHSFDAVLVWDLSRLTRKGPASAFAIIQRLATSGVELWSMTEEHFRTPIVGKLLIAVAAFLAEQERANISTRVRAGLDRARAHGKALGRPHRIFDRSKVIHLHAQGFSIRQIAARLTVSKSTVERTINGQVPGKSKERYGPESGDRPATEPSNAARRRPASRPDARKPPRSSGTGR